MPAATNILKMTANAGEGSPAAVTHDAELFASLFQAGSSGVGEALEGEGAVQTSAEAPATADTAAMPADAATLLPLLDQQRLVTVTPVIPDRIAPSQTTPLQIGQGGGSGIPVPVIADHSVATGNPIANEVERPPVHHCGVLAGGGASIGKGKGPADTGAPVVEPSAETDGSESNDPAATIATRDQQRFPAPDSTAPKPAPSAPRSPVETSTVAPRPSVNTPAVAPEPTAHTPVTATPIANAPAIAPEPTVDTSAKPRPSLNTPAVAPERVVATPVAATIASAAITTVGVVPIAKGSAQPAKAGEARITVTKDAGRPGAAVLPFAGHGKVAVAGFDAFRSESAPVADKVPTVTVTDSALPAEKPVAPLPLGTALQPSPAAITTPLPIPNLGAALAAQVLDMSRSGQWIDQLAQDISRAASSDGAMRFRLAPETLGELRVEITQSERGAHIRLNVTSEAAQQALTDAQSKLVTEARAQGVRIAETEISFAGGQGQGREASRQAPTPAGTPAMRAVRNAQPESGSDAARISSGPRTDRYA